MKPTTSRPRPVDETTGLLAGWNRWWFMPSDVFGLHCIRLCTGLLLLAWLLPLAGDVPAQFGIDGWFDAKALNEANRLPQTQLPKPITRWSLVYFAGTNVTALQAIYWGSIAVLVLFTVGIATRLTAPLTWVIVVSYMASPAFDEEVDPMLKMLAFYLAIAYLGLGLRTWKGRSWLERITGRRDAFLLGRLTRRPEDDQTSLAATVAMRLLQVHFAILIVTTGLHKLQNGAWWEGVAFWYNLYPPLTTSVATAREHLRDAPSFLSTLNLAAYAVLAWQLTFPLFAWRTGWWRVPLLGGAVIGWLGLSLLYQLPLFGPALVICAIAYISDREWLTIGGWFGRLRSQNHELPAPHFGSRVSVASTQER